MENVPLPNLSVHANLYIKSLKVTSDGHLKPYVAQMLHHFSRASKLAGDDQVPSRDPQAWREPVHLNKTRELPVIYMYLLYIQGDLDGTWGTLAKW